MKKKFTLTLLALVCALCCALGLTACGDEESDRVSCKVTPAAHVQQVWIGNDVLQALSDSQASSVWSLPRQIEKKELTIRVSLESYYEIGTLKMSINNTEVTLTPAADNSDISHAYLCQYTPTADMEIKFSGEAALAETTMTFAVDWTSIDQAINSGASDAADYEALKTNIKDHVNIRVLVNNTQKFSGSVRAFENGQYSPMTVHYKDTIKIYVITSVNTFLDIGDMFASNDGETTPYEDASNIGIQYEYSPVEREQEFIFNTILINKDVVYCPIKAGAKIEAPVGTAVSALYAEYPLLTNSDGKWELYMKVNENWVKLSDTDTIAAAGEYECKLVFAGNKYSANEVLFTIVGTAA